MREIDHTTLRYAGTQGEAVTVTVTPQNTAPIINFVLDGQSGALQPGGVIPCRVPSRLQLSLDFSNQSGGSYRISVRTVSNCARAAANNVQNECVRTVRQVGSLGDVLDFSFLVG